LPTPGDPFCQSGDIRRRTSVSVHGRICQQTFVDTYAKVAFAKLYTTKTPLRLLGACNGFSWSN
jgi:hypothetical protein